MRCAALRALVVSAVIACVGEASAAGRRPYGGALDLPVRDFSGLVDPHLAETRSGRLAASLAHVRLFRVVGDTISGELAEDAGSYANDVLTVTLVEGARFHDGAVITATDVVASLRRLAQLGDQSPIGRVVAALRVEERGPRVVAIGAPRGTVPDELRALLARPEAAICKGGQPRVGGGAFRPMPGEGETRVLVAWEGHALGRPWLQEVRLVRVAGAREEAAFRFGETGLSFEPLAAPAPTGANSLQGPSSSWLLVFHPRYRGEAGLRGWVRQAVLDARLQRYVDGRGLAGELPWPDGLAPTQAPGRQAQSYMWSRGRGNLVVAYAEGEADSEELGRALRDALRPLAGGEARVMAARGLTLQGARREADPAWDVALVRWDWAAFTRSQASHELARAFGIDGPSPADVLGRRTAEWARGLAQRHEVVAAAHAERPMSVTGRVRGVLPSGPLPELGGAYRAGRP